MDDLISFDGMFQWQPEDLLTLYSNAEDSREKITPSVNRYRQPCRSRKLGLPTPVRLLMQRCLGSRQIAMQLPGSLSFPLSVLADRGSTKV